MYDEYSLKTLAVAIIKQALEDIKYGTVQERSMAKSFFDSQSFEYWISLTNISPEAFRGKINIIAQKRGKQYVS